MDNLKKNFGNIYDLYIRKIYRFVYLKVNSQEIADDLTSETFARGWKAYRNRKEIKNPQAFLYRIAKNLVFDFYRKKGSVNMVSIDNCKEMSDPNVKLEENAFVASDMRQVRTALSRLKEDHQNVIIWYYLEEMSVPEIAEIMNKSEEAVRTTIHRALKSLKRELHYLS